LQLVLYAVVLLEENRYATTAVAPRAYLDAAPFIAGRKCMPLNARLPSTAAENKMHSCTERDAVTAQQLLHARKKYFHALVPSLK